MRGISPNRAASDGNSSRPAEIPTNANHNLTGSTISGGCYVRGLSELKMFKRCAWLTAAGAFVTLSFSWRMYFPSHARNVQFIDVELGTRTADSRPRIHMDDVEGFIER